jgi:hypothetical protein
MKLTVFLICCLAARAQESPEFKVNVNEFRYPRLPQSARIQGDVVFEGSASDLKLISGHPLLVPAARVNLAGWRLPPLNQDKYKIIYHFFLLDAPVRRETVLIGNTFDRFFLRLFRARTERVVEWRCKGDPGMGPASNYLLSRQEETIIDVFVTGWFACGNV